MPEISSFFGISIYMYNESGGKHHRPHFHAIYQDYEAIFLLGSLRIAGGSMPVRQRRLIEAWAEIHADELKASWESLQQGVKPRKIEGLK